MKSLLILAILFYSITQLEGQTIPCGANNHYNDFNFWIGDWDVFDPKGNKAGSSKISRILDQCVILEEWTSANAQQGLVYTGKSFNTYDISTGEWQQTWVDNTGSSTEFLQGEFHEGKMVFQTTPQIIRPDSVVIQRLTFFALEENRVRQLGEISTNGGGNWTIQYDLMYHRKVLGPKEEITANYFRMDSLFASNEMEKIAEVYSPDAIITGNGFQIKGQEAIQHYWGQLQNRGVSWDHEINTLEVYDHIAIQTGISELIYTLDGKEIVSKVRYTVIWEFLAEKGWCISSDHYTTF